MQLRPRHYILLAVILGLFVYNIVRHRRDDRNAISTNTAPAPIVITKPRLDTPAWAAYDHAAGLRDESDADFQAALADLRRLMPLDPNQGDGHLTDIKGCLTWLDFYRQGMAQTNPNPQMKTRSIRHIDDCVKYHLDTGA